MLWIAFMPIPLAAQAPVTMRDVELRGIMRGATREITAQFRVSVATPLGRVWMTGHGQLEYTCAGSFTGRVDYHPLVRLLARIKGLALVRSLDGYAKFEELPDCASSSESRLAGRAAVDSTEMRGWVKMGADSLVFGGPTWITGTTYYGVLTSKYRNRPFELRINMYETTQPHRALESRAASFSAGVKGCEKNGCPTAPLLR